MNKLSFHRFG